MFSVNPYSSSWSPSTVAILKSPLRSRSSSKASTSLDLMQCSLYSPAPNLILQPSPAIDLAPNYATGARTSISRAMLRRGTSETSSLLVYHVPVYGPQAMDTQSPLAASNNSNNSNRNSNGSNVESNPNINHNNAAGHNTPTTALITQLDNALMDSVVSTDRPFSLLQRTTPPGYPTPAQRRLLIDLHYNIMLRGPVFIDFLSKLPYEIAVYILLFVDMHNLTKVALISRTWNQFSRDNEVWKNVFLHQKQWRVRVPPALPRKAIAESTAATAAALVAATSSTSSSSYLESAITTTKAPAQSIKPLNWKMLCHDRIQLERRWTTVPPKTKLLDHTDSVYCVQFDHSKIVTGSRDQTIKFWDLHTLKCLHTLRGHSQSVLCLQFNDKIMVSGSSDNTIIVWDMEKRLLLSRLHGHTAGVLDVCFDDQYIVSCSKDTTIKVWDVKTFALVKTMQGHRGPVNAVQLHRGQIVSASGDGMVKLWNIGSGQCIRDFIGHDRGLACVQFDGETIVSGSNDKTIRIWEASTGRCLRVLTGHTALVRTLHFENNRIVSGSYDHTVKVWDMTTGLCTLDLDSGHSSWVFDVQFSSSRIISTSQDRNIIVWDFSGDLDVRLFE
ncbi:hypothetical protein BGZ95_003366 [Linnemannia exigua]|uniref:F-box domain-containing protein n=1 Tax=Linnemannia exigua TaxID=604196 RepID=A0AAD4D498_9FUNG|nr:hypothetical protein BGZ95_003366 [Linnemannia exigua]